MEFDVADRANRHSASSSAARALVTLTRARPTPAAEPKTCFADRDDRHSLTLHRLSEDRSDVGPLTNRFSNPFEKCVHHLSMLMRLHRHAGLLSVAATHHPMLPAPRGPASSS